VYRLFCCLLAGALGLHSQDLSSDKHHVLIFQNELIRIYHLTFAPTEATAVHRHSHPYAYLSLEDVQISNEAPGHKPRVVEITAGDVHTSKGGFELVERNVGLNTAAVVVVEQLGDAAAFTDAMADYKVHEAALASVLEQPGMRAYSTRMAVTGKTEPHPELHDRLILAVTDMQVVDQAAGQAQVPLKLKSGEVKWLPKGGNHSLSNTGDTACSFLTFEFP
jgi:hypothetical protein